MANDLVVDPAAPAAPVAPAPAAPAPVAAAAPIAPAPSSSSDGGDSGGDDSLVSIVKNLNWTEVIFGLLGATALYYTIYYFKYNLDAGKGFQTGIQNKVDELTMKIADIDSTMATKSPQQGFDGTW